MRHYETTFILRPNLGEEQTTEIIDRAVGIITGDEGSVICTAGASSASPTRSTRKSRATTST